VKVISENRQSQLSTQDKPPQTLSGEIIHITCCYVVLYVAKTMNL